MELVRRIEDLPKDEKDKPSPEVVIEACGELPREGEGEKTGADAN